LASGHVIRDVLKHWATRGRKGAAISAVASGTGTVLVTKGKEAQVTPGTIVTALLEEAVTVTAPFK
jgi:hypothetical protein